MKAWSYGIKGWTEIDLPDWEDGEEISKYMDRIGFFSTPTQILGNQSMDGAPRLTIYSKQDDHSELPAYICDLDPITWHTADFLCAPDGLGLGLLVNLFAPALSLGILTSLYESLLHDERGFFDDKRLDKLGKLIDYFGG